MESSLFRQEVAVSRSERVFGDVAVLIPTSWHAVGALLFAAVVVAVAFASFATYGRVVTVTGSVVPTAGVAAIVPAKSGVIVGLAVAEGQRVEAGQPVASIRSEADPTEGLSVGERIERAIARQDANVLLQLRASQSAARSGEQQLDAQRAGLKAEIAQIVSQLSFQKTLITSSQRAYDRAAKIAARGFISQRDLEALQDAVVTREQIMAQLTQSLAAKRSQLSEVERLAAQSRFQSTAQAAALEGSRAQIEQQAAAAQGNRSYLIRAPIAGQVTALTARVGQAATTQGGLMSIVPTASPLRVELAVPSAGIGFVRPGQTVRLAIDAFPYQRFGTIGGTVSTVATSPVAQMVANGSTMAVYPVMVSLQSPWLMAYGRQERLVPGMTLTARIVTQRQSLLQWLFDPLFAVARR